MQKHYYICLRESNTENIGLIDRETETIMYWLVDCKLGRYRQLQDLGLIYWIGLF